MKTQLRPFWSPEKLAEIYSRPYDHTLWPDHRDRIKTTVELGTEFGRGRNWYDGIDLACGDGAILGGLTANGTVQYGYFGDMVQAKPPMALDVLGAIEDTLPAHIKPSGKVWDLFVCTETLEHVEDPDSLLRNARHLADHMILSTPISETLQHGNDEHYWSWSTYDVEEMLDMADWRKHELHVLTYSFYNFQIWLCS